MDRLIELPNEVINLIFSKLDMRDVVRTTVLSKRWVNLWTTVECLNFEISSVEANKNFINHVIERWSGVKIEIFKIDDRDFRCYPSFSADMSFWIRFAIDRKVEELHILLFSKVHPSGYHSFFTPPPSLYSCSSIRELTLVACSIQSSSNVCWDQLKSLVIEGGELSEDMVSLVLANSPKLETLRLLRWIRPHNACIHSSTLQTLEIASRDLYSLDDTLLISAPRLRELTIRGHAYSKLLITDPSSLTKVVLGLNDARAEMIGETLKGILVSIRYVEVVTLSFHCFQAMRIVLRGGLSFSPLRNVKLLEFSCCLNLKMGDIVGILETFPKIERLRVMIDWYRVEYDHGGIFYDLQDVGDVAATPGFENLESFLPNLKRVDVVWSTYDSKIFGFIESLLKHATEVRKVVIQPSEDWGPKLAYPKAERKRFASLKSSFPNVKLILCRFRDEWKSS